jgi:hypothetical protein
MCNEQSKRFGRTPSSIVAACAFAVGAMSAYCETGLAQQSSVSGRSQAQAGVLRIAELEKAFWACDYVATTRGVHAAPVAICSAVTDEIKNAKFGGDFEELLKWWQQKKPSEHQKLAGSDVQAGFEAVADR